MIIYSAQDTRLAAAVLLYRVIVVDGHVRDAELRRYREILQDYIKVPPDELALFENLVRERYYGANSVPDCTDIVSKMSSETKRAILKFMEDISVSDNEFHEFEINLVTVTAKLLGLSDDELGR
jgi:uncharacterized tellurite resistance protein B-like protein